MLKIYSAEDTHAQAMNQGAERVTVPRTLHWLPVEDSIRLKILLMGSDSIYIWCGPNIRQTALRSHPQVDDRCVRPSAGLTALRFRTTYDAGQTRALDHLYGTVSH